MIEGKKSLRVLSIDGGGMRGVYSSTYLSALAKELAKRENVNNRSVPVYLRHPDGREQIDDYGNKMIDDEITAVPMAFRAWRESRI